ncbi:asparagine--tRNA ligase, mitochondrial [Brevipalpus obovatus]|uniref:asparagine--tRNA ligase, mitochondrial n=1 Tax=Brevipalpus obovatus TaxID=246614 RepID=UPI003D9F1258
MMTKLCFMRNCLPILRPSTLGRSFSTRLSSSSSLPSDDDDDQSDESIKKPSLKRTSLIVGTENIPQLTVAEIFAHATIDQKVAVQGWVRSLRRLKNHYFLSVSDGLSNKRIQVVVPTHLFGPDGRAEFGSCVSCVGNFVQSKGPEQSVEIYCEKIDILGHCKPADYPFLTSTGLSGDWKVMRGFPHLRPRVPPFAALMRLRSDIYQEIHQIMKENEYVHITTPIMTKNDCEGGCKSFLVKSPDDKEDFSYFDDQVKLTVSAQLHLETAASALSRVYTIGPTFRAENTKSRRHLSEFTMFEVEEAFIKDLDSLMDRVEFIMKSLVEVINPEKNENVEKLLKITKFESFEQLRKPYFRITYKEAVDLLNQRQKIQPISYGQDLSVYHETVILNYFENRPTFITHFPMSLKPFYMKSLNNEALCFDLITMVGGEVCGGSLREDNLEILKANMTHMGNVQNLEWYLDLRRYGGVPLGGFGFGFDRMIQTFTGLKSIKDVVPFPRFAHSCKL